MSFELILQKSKEVFLKCSLPNGAIIAADVFNKIYPENVKWYGYVWLRDASFVCYACDLLKMHEIPRKFFDWLLKAEGLKEGIFAHKYYPNGRIVGDFDLNLDFQNVKGNLKKILKNYLKTKVFYIQFQADQLGTLIWAIYEHSKFENEEKFKEIVEILANSICKNWNKTHFKIPSFDLWEEKVALPKLKQVHTYSLASCIKGLECAMQILGEREEWKKTLKQMKRVLNKCYSENLGYFVKTYGKIIDETLDSSNVALVWPFEQFNASDERIVKTIEKIIQFNEKNGGIYRYQNDKYDGKIELCDLKLGGAGAWPILNYWLSIYFSLKEEKEKALKYFNWVNEKCLKWEKEYKGYLPEQIKEEKPYSIIPLAWSHAMFVIAAKFIGLMKK